MLKTDRRLISKRRVDATSHHKPTIAVPQAKGKLMHVNRVTVTVHEYQYGNDKVITARDQ